MRENRIRRKSKVSDGRSVRVGLGGPKPRPQGVGDGQPVNIPAPPGGAQRGRGGIAQPVSGFRWQPGNARRAGAFGPQVGKCYRREKPHV